MLCHTDKESFIGALEEWYTRWEDFLKERTITEDGKVNGNILENTNEKRKVIETAFAYLIITIQTGVNQIKYIIYIVAIVSIILGLGLAFKQQRKLSREV